MVEKSGDFDEEREKKESYAKILDELLDKINREGFDSLTPSEKRLLKKVSEYLEDESKNDKKVK